MTRVRLSVVGAILLVAITGALLWFFVLSPRLSEASDLSAQATQLQTINLSLQKQYNQALDQAEQAPQAAADAQALFAKMPQTADLPTVLDQITTAAVDAGISANAVSSLTTGIPVPVTGTQGAAVTEQPATGVQLARMDVGVSTAGAPVQVLAFLDNLQLLDRALLVKSTVTSQVSQVTDEPAAELENVQVGGSMFVLQSKLPDLVAEVESLIAQAEQDQAAINPS